MVFTKEERDIKVYLDRLKSVHVKATVRHEERETKILKITRDLKTQAAQRMLNEKDKTFNLSYSEKTLFKKDKLTRKELEKIVDDR